MITNDYFFLLLIFCFIKEKKIWKEINIPGFKGRARFGLAELGEGKVAIVGGCKSNRSHFNSYGRYCKDMLIIDLAYETIIIREKVIPALRVVNPTACAIDSNILVFGGFNKRQQVNTELYVMTVQGI